MHPAILALVAVGVLGGFPLIAYGIRIAVARGCFHDVQCSSPQACVRDNSLGHALDDDGLCEVWCDATHACPTGAFCNEMGLSHGECLYP